MALDLSLELDPLLVLLELYEYKVEDLRQGRPAKHGAIGVAALRDQLREQLADPALLRRFRQIDERFLGADKGASPAAPPTAEPQMDLQIPALSIDFSVGSLAEADPERQALMRLEELAWSYQLDEGIRTLSEGYRKDASKIMLRGLYALVANFDLHAQFPEGRKDAALRTFQVRKAVPAENDPLVSLQDEEAAFKAVRAVFDRILDFPNWFPELSLPEVERLAHLRKMAQLVAESAFSVPEPAQPGPSSKELARHMESVRREPLGAQARQEMLARLQTQFEAAVQREQRLQAVQRREQDQLSTGLIQFFENARNLLLDRFGGSVALSPAKQVLFAASPRRAMREPVAESRMVVRLAEPSEAKIGKVTLRWQRSGEDWLVDVGPARYLIAERLIIPSDSFELRIFRSGEYALFQLVEGTKGSLAELLRLARGTALLLDPSQHYLNLRLVRGLLSLLREGQLKAAQLSEDDGSRYGRTPPDQLTAFARRGAEQLLGRVDRLPLAQLQAGLREVGAALGAGPERSTRLLGELSRSATPTNPGLIDNALRVDDPMDVALLGYRGDPITVMVRGRALTLRADYTGAVAVVLPGSPALPIEDLAVIPLSEGHALLARQGLRLAVSYQPFLG